MLLGDLEGPDLLRIEAFLLLLFQVHNRGALIRVKVSVITTITFKGGLQLKINLGVIQVMYFLQDEANATDA